MKPRHLLPIPLPAGRTGDTGHLSVYFSFRLKDDGLLGRPDYPELEDWPDTLGSRLQIQVDVDGTIVNHRLVSPPPSSTVWGALFPPQDPVPVKGHRFKDWSQGPAVEPMASSDFSEAVLDLYVALADGHPEHPPAGTDLVSIDEATVLLDGRTDPEDPARPGSLDEANDYAAPMDESRHDEDDSELDKPSWDFHEYVSLLGHHPELLRHCGLVVDLDIDLPAGASPGLVTVRTGFDQSPGAREVTVAMTTNAKFTAEPNPDQRLREQVDGFLDFEDQEAFLSIIDPHLAAMRLTPVQAQLAAEDQGLGDLPTLSTRAMSLIRPDVIKAWRNRVGRQAQLEQEVFDQLSLPPGQGMPVQTFAEDTTIGHRIDVDHQGTWRSLFDRKAGQEGYDFPLDPTIDIHPIPDEGWNSTILVTEQQEQLVNAPIGENDKVVAPTALRRLDDALFRWGGWSGAVAPPGGSVDGASVAEVDPNEPGSDDPVQFKVDYEAVPGSLPRLRFGEQYRMRARCVDLAGNAVTPDQAGPDAAATGIEPFGRLEPVSSPIVVRDEPRLDPGVGDMAATLVIRSELEPPAKEARPTSRLVFPPAVGQDLCEFHGLPKGGVDRESYEDLCARDSVTLTDQTTTDTRTGEIIAPGVANQEVRYLSDPAASGVRFSVPLAGGETVVELGDEWPTRRSLRMVLTGGINGQSVAPDAETDLEVTLDKAEIAGATLSFALDPEMLDHFGLWQRLDPSRAEELLDLALAGGHWMLSARKELTLVHAVRLPLLQPSVVDLEAGREAGAKAIDLDGLLDVHRKSTDRVVMTGSWTDPIDDVTQDGPVERTVSVPLGELRVTRAETTEQPVDQRAPLPDTKHHRAEVSLEAYSSFSHYFTERRDLIVTAKTIELDARGVVPSSVEITVVGEDRRPVEGTDYEVRAESGTLAIDTRSIPIGSSLDVSYIPLPVSRVSAETFTLNIPNAVAPPPAVVHAVLPAFARFSGETDGRVETTHRGHVLRVYLERPWFTSGQGEMLGVVVANDPSDLASGTWIGRDPIVAEAGPASGPGVTSFPRRTLTVDADDGRHRFACHDVTYDERQRRWFADIEVESAEYRPFVRLVLARVQPDSVPGAEASTFVTTAPIRLGVDRTVVVRLDGEEVEVEVTGSLHDGIPDATRRNATLLNTIRATVQQAEAKIVDTDLAWSDTDLTIELDPVMEGKTASWCGRLSSVKPSSGLRLLVEELEPAMRRTDAGVEATTNVVYVETVVLETGAGRR